MSSARFTIAGSPFSSGGYDAAGGAVLALQLEDSPATDIGSCVYSVVRKTKGASAPVLAGAGVASPPTAPVNITLPGDCQSYEVQCQTNGGAAILVAGRPDFSVNTKSRIVSVRGAVSGLRKTVIGESTQYDPTFGWFGAQNELVDCLEGQQGISTPSVVTNDATTHMPLFTFAVPAGGMVYLRSRIFAKCTSGGGAGATCVMELAVNYVDVAGTATAVAVTTPASGLLVLADNSGGVITTSKIGVDRVGLVGTVYALGVAGSIIAWKIRPQLDPLTF